MLDQLKKLRDEYGCCGIKAEFEAEGSSYKDLVRLRRVTDQAGLPLFLKIGGPEAVRDIRDAYEIGVDGIIAPMVESQFGAKKFLDACREVYREKEVHKTINIETAQAVYNIDGILKYKPYIDTITFGRSDLSASYLMKEITPDCAFIFSLLKVTADKVPNELTVTIGGSISNSSIIEFRKDRFWHGMVSKLETRKVMLPLAEMLRSGALTECLKFEELYIQDKKDISDRAMESELSRLTRLRERL